MPIDIIPEWMASLEDEDVAFVKKFLQVFLSKRESKWLGLILPFITLCFSLLFVLNMVVMPTG
jgi:hypothetical protein